MLRVEAANRRFVHDVEKARSLMAVQAKLEEGRVDRLTSELTEYLVEVWRRDELELDAEFRWTARPLADKRRGQASLRASTQEDLTEALDLRGLGDLDSIVALWGEPAAGHAASLGYRLDRSAPEFAEYVRLLHDAQIAAWRTILRRLDGENIPTPAEPRPPRKAAAPSGPPQSLQAIVEGLLESERLGISATTKEATRTALRLFRATNGTPVPEEITRAMVADWLDVLAKRPSKLPKEHRATPLPELVRPLRIVMVGLVKPHLQGRLHSARVQALDV
jgi:hypothetical protein